ncbi:protein LlR18B-like [Abrus precatorius]|uniref:Protein LlR18B-like n=1 Tax=Abrus precatorius TaxID=3816 RepID=A0A8B8JEE7_ABRPR|nr:protein LlR18B-like [Abrus precatorius]
MGVFTFEDEHISPATPAKLFKALVKDSDSIIPKFIEAIHSIEIVEGNGGPGTIKKITVVEGGKTSYVLHKVEAIDETHFGYNYSIIGGTGLEEILEKVEFETKILAGPNGGSLAKASVKYHTKGDAPLSDELRESTKAKGTGLFKAVEGYVLANPDY